MPKLSVVRSGAMPYESGERSYLRYKDLGLVSATDGKYMGAMITAHEAIEAPTGQHIHILDFQIVHVLSGELEFWIKDQGRVILDAGTFFHMPSGTPHNLVRATKGSEWIEITSPAEIETVVTDYDES